MTFPFDPNIPFATNYPGDDQPKMKQNNQSIAAWVNVDHIQFGTPGPAPGGSGGQHKQVTFNGKNTPTAIISDPLSILFTADGVARTDSNLLYKNDKNTTPISIIRAYAVFTGQGAIAPNPASTVNVLNKINIASIVKQAPAFDPTTGTVTVTLDADVITNALMSQTFGILLTPQHDFTVNGAVITITGVPDGDISTIVVLQI